MARPVSLLVLGLGNLLLSDDGLGVVAVAELARSYQAPEGVQLLDGGTLGLALLHHVAQAENVILVDAVAADAPPGTLVRLGGEEVPPAVHHRLSPHQVGVADLLDGLRWLGRYPRRLVLLGMVPGTLELSVGLSPAVAARLPELVARVAHEAADLGFDLEPRRGHDPVAARPAGAGALALGV